MGEARVGAAWEGALEGALEASVKPAGPAKECISGDSVGATAQEEACCGG